MAAAGQGIGYTGAAAPSLKNNGFWPNQACEADWFCDALKEKGIVPCFPGLKSRNKAVTLVLTPMDFPAPCHASVPLHKVGRILPRWTF